MPKLSEIIALLLLPVFVSSTVIFNISLMSEAFHNGTEISYSEFPAESESSEQNEESNEGENDITIINSLHYNCLIVIACCCNSISTFHTDNFPEYYSPPPEMMIIRI